MKVILAALAIGFASPAFAECAVGYTQVTVPLCQQNSFTVGYTTTPTAGFGNSYTAGYNFANGPYTMPQSGTIQSCSVWLASGPSGQMQCGVYSAISYSQPGTLLAASAQFTPVAGWNTVATTTNPVITSGASIFMGAIDTASSPTLADAHTGFNLYGDNDSETTLQTTFLSPAHLDASAFQLGAYATFQPCTGSCFPPAFYVAPATASPAGSDSNPGTLAAPFLTLPKCQSAMNTSSTKLCYIRAGTYAPAGLNACNSRGNCAVGLTTADNGETWSYYPPDGVNTADITGGSTASGNGLWAIFFTGGATNVTFNGLKMHNFNFAAVQSGGGSGLTVTNSLMYNGFGIIGDASLSGAQNAAAVMCYGCANATVSHNAVHDMASLGISISGGGTNNLLYDSNVLYNTCTQIRDCGALYTQDLGTTKSTNQRMTNNYIWDGCTFSGCGTGSGGWGSAIYLDDCASNWTIDHNVIRSQSGSNNLFIHGGSNDVFKSNIVDLATQGQPILRLQTSSCPTITGNSFGSSIVISNGAAGGYNGTSGAVTIPTDSTHKNIYWNYGSGTLSTSGDSSPVTGSNPLLNCYTYQVTAGSPVFASPVNFTDLSRGWGPPNYVLPQTGTAPSQPHAC